MDAAAVIARLDLAPHPEGGWYRETWRGPAGADGRAAGTAIYFLLERGARSHWHRVDASEVWLYHVGAALSLWVSPTAAGPARETRLGPDLEAGERPQAVVPVDAWQAAETLGDWTLVSCTVAPGFTFDGFTLAAPAFDIPRS